MNFYEAVMKLEEPFFLTRICPQCGSELESKKTCEHGEIFTCEDCCFKSFVEYQGIVDDCVHCSIHYLND